MGRIDMGRVMLGGLVAGVVINISEFVLNQVVLLSDMTTALARMNLPPIGGLAIPVFILLGFAGGIAAVWLYAAIRPRFGPGPMTGPTVRASAARAGTRAAAASPTRAIGAFGSTQNSARRIEGQERGSRAAPACSTIPPRRPDEGNARRSR